MQQAFYVNGQSLSDTATYFEIATAAGSDTARVEDMLASGEGAKIAAADFAEARELGVSAYPTLLFINKRRVHRFAAAGTALEAMNRALDEALAES